MKLTIKNKVYRGREREQKDDSFSQEMWCAENVGRKKVIHERSKSLSNMIETDLYQHYSRIMYKEKIRTSDIHTFIIETVEDKKCQYSRGLGYLCCHVYGHYSSEGERIHIINTMLSTYKSIYWKNNEELKFSVINSAATRIEQYCEPNRQILQEMDLYSIVQTCIQTLLLEYIPLQYSEFIIQVYITNPYEQFIRLLVSLVHFVLNTRNITSAIHATNILKNPYMGLIEWPIVISNRHTFVKQEWTNMSSISSN